ncbi:helix-turn-helix transcriptional regulator [Aureliella helgolandensis]|uniref:Bifunctional transcriptional activator/DNA repair enzyme AdaA n=1 Tax=Aureliella helgolandensis TaxID=2527968 RepID=A0A518G0J3_9BACT|nr:helix-turn-helix domain-containing protein [Aureliella helgolandensis]QDV22060.1 Bifunctional transcriptional activator/DNA repair enzyme AdaA [Aureliella helgolandensis]
MNSIQRDFYQQLGQVQRFQELFEHLPGIYFFVKDAESRMMGASPGILARFGLSHEDDIIGTSDYDYFPQHIAAKFVEDDQQVMQTGTALIGRVEIWYTEQRLLDWFITNKHPIRDEQQRIVGVMGTVRSYEGSRRSFQTYTQIDKVVEHIRERHASRLTVTDLARIADLSPRQLHRKFLEFFGMNVQEFLSRTRIQAASDALLKTDAPIADIALRYGFCDQSAFTQQFKKHAGITPHKFRKINAQQPKPVP